MAIKVSSTIVIDDSRVLKNLGSAITADQGGTGLTTLTAENLLVGNGTGTVKFVAPGTSANVLTSNGTHWISKSLPATGDFNSVSIINTNTTAVSRTMYVATANLTLTLPATPAAGDIVGFSNMTGYANTIIARNGSDIMNLAENMTVDVADAGFTLIYSNTQYGWVII